MAQENVPVASEVAFVAHETTFASATPPTMSPCIIEQDSFDNGLTQEELENKDSSARMHDYQDPVLGLKSEGSTLKFACGVRPHASQITAAAPGTIPYLHLLWHAMLGGQQLGAGSALAAGPVDGTTVTVLSAAGFAIGQVIAIQNTGAGTVEVAVITNIVGAVLSLYPTLSATATAGFALNSFHNFLTETNSKSLIFQHARPINGSTRQIQGSGCIGKFSLKTERGKLVMSEFDLMVTNWSRGSLGLSSAVQTNPMASARWAVKDAVLYLQPAATATRVSYCAEQFELTVDPGMERTPCHDGTEGFGSVMRVGTRGAVKFKLRVRADEDQFTRWTARTELRLMYAIPQGSGTAKRWFVVYANKVVIVGMPKAVKEGGRLVYELELIAKIDNTAAADSAAGAPVSITTI